MSICNKKPTFDGKPLASDYSNKLLGADYRTEFTFKYPKTGFECYKDQKPPKPHPNQPPKPHNDDVNVGGHCSHNDQCIYGMDKD